MDNARSDQTSARDRRRLQRAYESGYLDAPSSNGAQLLAAYGFWCWRRRLPMVWLERRSARSEYGRVHLDMFTTPYRLTATACASIEAIEVQARRNQVEITAHEACWNWVPRHQLESVARRVLASATRMGHYEPNRPKLVSISVARRGPVSISPPARAASA